MFDDIPPWMVVFWWTTIGLFVGSFLNVAIYRLPLEGETVSRPARSRCPECKTELAWSDNIPILSWILLRGRCRTCRCRISIRYPLVEGLTALLWGLAAALVPPEAWALTGVRVLVLSGLVVATFVDFDYFEIPDEVSIGGMVLAVILSLAVPELHAATWLAREFSEAAGAGVDRFGAVIGCLGGMVVGGGVLWLIGWLGGKVFGGDAMGFGDVKLLAAGGGFVGPGGVLLALMLAAFVASIVGIGNIGRYFCLTRRRATSRGRRPDVARSIRVARIAGRYLPFGPYLALGIGIVLLYWNHVSLLAF